MSCQRCRHERPDQSLYLPRRSGRLARHRSDSGQALLRSRVVRARTPSNFHATWLHVGHVCELPRPGTWIKRDLEFANASILIVRGKDGEIRAFHNVCTHRGTQLVEEDSGKGSTYHAWNFGDDGA